MKKIYLMCFFGLFIQVCSNAQESIDAKWYFQPSAFFFDLGVASSETTIGGMQLPGENVSFTNSTVPGEGIVYMVNPNISIHTVIAYPPTATAEGSNNLEGLQQLKLHMRLLQFLDSTTTQLVTFNRFLVEV